MQQLEEYPGHLLQQTGHRYASLSTGLSYNLKAVTVNDTEHRERTVTNDGGN